MGIGRLFCLVFCLFRRKDMMKERNTEPETSKKSAYDHRTLKSKNSLIHQGNHTFGRTILPRDPTSLFFKSFLSTALSLCTQTRKILKRHRKRSRLQKITDKTKNMSDQNS